MNLSKFLFFFSLQSSTSDVGFLSLVSHVLSDYLNYPPIKMHQKSPLFDQHKSWSALSEDWPCDLHLVNMRSMDVDLERPGTLLILHRYGIDCSFPDTHFTCPISDGRFTWNDKFATLKVTSPQEMVLTGIKPKTDSKSNSHSFTMDPMEIKTFKVNLL